MISVTILENWIDKDYPNKPFLFSESENVTILAIVFDRIISKIAVDYKHKTNV